MIDKTLFQTSRDVARAKLPAEEAANSFGYYIDLGNGWENYYCPERLILWLGIHSTHLQQFPELLHNLGDVTPAELDWMRRYAAFCDTTSKLLSTTGFRVDLRYDMAETLTDWRNIQRFKKLPARVLDFGAGCARQGLSAFLLNKDCTYVAVDGTLAGYTLQNLVLSTMDVLGAGETHDFLDYETVQKPYPRIAESKPGSRFHVPVWLIEENLPERYFDVMIGAHVAYELSGYDFHRFMRCVERGLADDGIFYLRSEISSSDWRDFQGAVDLHGTNLVGLLQDKGIVPIHCEYDTYLTTVFARRGSQPHRDALASSETARELDKASENIDLSRGAAYRYLKRRIGEVIANGQRIAAFGGGANVFETMVRPELKGLSQDPLIVPTAANSEELHQQLLAYDPDALIIAGGDLGAQEANLKAMLGEGTYTLRFSQLLPVVILLRDRCSRANPIFSKAIYRPSDIDPAQPVPLHTIFPNQSA